MQTQLQLASWSHALSFLHMLNRSLYALLQQNPSLVDELAPIRAQILLEFLRYTIFS